MVDAATVRRLALALPEAQDGSGDSFLKFEVAGKGFAWTYLARLKPKGPRLPHLDVLAVRCAIEKKQMLIEAAPDRFFDDDHYRGYPAVLVRLEVVETDELSALLAEAWRLTAPKALAKRHAAANLG
jgi:hypothetical protein